ncbi:MAG: pilin [bacterium]|nr:pilin [bacterium]
MLNKNLIAIVAGGILIFSFLVAGSINAAPILGPGESCGECYNGATEQNTACSVSKPCPTGQTCGAVTGNAPDTCNTAEATCNPGTLICTRIADIWGPKDVDVLAAQAGLGTDDPREIVSNVINVIIGFLGIIAVVLIIAGGFMWMTAAGNDDKIATSKKLMTAGVIGLVILLAAFGVAKFVVDALLGATGA